MMGFVHQGLYFKVTGRNAAEAPITLMNRRQHGCSVAAPRKPFHLRLEDSRPVLRGVPIFFPQNRPVFPPENMHVHASPCVSMLLHASPCVSMRLHACPCLSMPAHVWTCRVTCISPRIALFFPQEHGHTWIRHVHAMSTPSPRHVHDFLGEKQGDSGGKK